MKHLLEVGLAQIFSLLEIAPYTLRRLYFATAEVRFMFSSSFRKLGLAFNLEYLCQFFINFNNQCQFWNPYDKQITNLSLIFKFNEEIMEKIGNQKDESKLIFEKYQLSLTSNILAKISSKSTNSIDN